MTFMKVIQREFSYYLVITSPTLFFSLPALAPLARNWRSPRNYFNFLIFSSARDQSAIHELRVHTVAALFHEIVNRANGRVLT